MAVSLENAIQDPQPGEPVVIQITSAKSKLSKTGSGVVYVSLGWAIISGEGLGYSGWENVMVLHPSKPAINGRWIREAAQIFKTILGFSPPDLPDRADDKESVTLSKLPKNAVQVTLKWEEGNDQYPGKFVIDRWIEHVDPDDIERPEIGDDFVGGEEGDVL